MAESPNTKVEQAGGGRGIDGYQDKKWLDETMPTEFSVRSQRRVVYPLLFDDELDNVERPEWLIEGVLPSSSLAVLHGQPGVGKTFLALDWALSVAEGEDWQGRQVQQGTVVYVCAEGWRGARDRVSAWKQTRGILSGERSGVAFLGKPIRLLDYRDVLAFGDSIESACVGPALVVIDTLARNAVGLDENSAKDMGQIVSSCDDLRERFDCTVLLVHHSTKGGQFAPVLRGSGALKGAADMVAVVREDGDHVALSSEKQKEGAPFKRMRFRLVPAGNSVVLVAEGREPKKVRQEEVWQT